MCSPGVAPAQGSDNDEGQDDDKEDEGDKRVTLVPQIRANLYVLQEPVKPEPLLPPEVRWDKDMEAFGHVLDYTTNQEVRW